MTKEFTLFPQLIVELRLLVWRYALPNPVGHNPVYQYNKECWTLKERSNPRSTRRGSEDSDLLVFDTSRIEPLQFKLPLLAVNREARDVAQDFIRRQNLTALDLENQTAFRLFDPTTDIILIPDADISAFLGGPNKQISDSRSHNRGVSFYHPSSFRCTITSSGLDAIEAKLYDFFRFGACNITLYVIDDDEKTSNCVATCPQEHWELLGSPSNRFVWKDCGGFKFEYPENDTTKIKKIRNSVNALIDQYLDPGDEGGFIPETFEIQFGELIKKTH